MMQTNLQRKIMPLVAAAGLSILPAMSFTARADDTSTGNNAQPTFTQSVDKAAQDTGDAIGTGAKNVGHAIENKSEDAAAATQQGAQQAGNKVEQAADDTGNWIDRAAVKTRDKTAAFFNRVGEFFAGP